MLMLLPRPLPAPLLAPRRPARAGRAAPLSQPRRLMAEGSSREPPPRRRPPMRAPVVAGAAAAASGGTPLPAATAALLLEPTATRPSPTLRRGPAAPSGQSRPCEGAGPSRPG